VKARREIKKKTAIRKAQLRVMSLSAGANSGWLAWGGQRVRCAIGRGGRKALKREGDGATPLGHFALKDAYYRADRITRPRLGRALRALRRDDGWCDAVGDRNYNRPVRHPYASSAERMWREDGLYDLVVVLDYNLRPRIAGRGSAIFLHCARSGHAPTEGCIAVRREELVRLLQRIGRGGVLRTM
jgi:L,D-peptidoglycan transpeptidase YkuD (ErfK/YbiS/YcfS/YnhG family)